MDNPLDKIREEGRELRKEVRQRTVGYIVAGLGLVVGLAWNEAIKSLIEEFFPLGQDTLLAKFTYAIVITLVLVITTVYVLKPTSEEKK